MLIDTHVHLNIEPLYGRWKEIFNQAKQAGVERCIVPGANLESSRRGIEIADQTEEVWAAVGIHPEEVDKTGRRVDRWIGSQVVELERLAKSNKVVAIGECGLDYHYTQENKEQQKKLFQLQVDLAKKMDLPVIVHTRGETAMADAGTILGGYDRCVYHCFSGDTDPGVFVGIGGTITYKGNDQLRQTVQRIPLERIILETDAPWLSPEPVRGTTNVPANLVMTALKLAELKQLPLSQIMEQTTINAKRLFLRNT